MSGGRGQRQTMHYWSVSFFVSGTGVCHFSFRGDKLAL